MVTKAYIARLQHNKEAVGIFVARNVGELFSQIEQIGDPFACEYTRLSDSGGIGWPNSGCWKVKPTDEEVLIDDAILTSPWDELFFEDSEAWENFKDYPEGYIK